MSTWACAIHRVQGIVLSKALISRQVITQKYFDNGQLYAAFSRVLSLEGFHLIGSYKSEVTAVNKNISHQYALMRCHCSITETSDGDVQSKELTFILHNKRFMYKYVLDIRKAPSL